MTIFVSLRGPFWNSNQLTSECYVLKEDCTDQDKFKSLAVYEWARLNPNRIVDFI